MVNCVRVSSILLLHFLLGLSAPFFKVQVNAAPLVLWLLLLALKSRAVLSMRMLKSPSIDEFLCVEVSLVVLLLIYSESLLWTARSPHPLLSPSAFCTAVFLMYTSRILYSNGSLFSLVVFFFFFLV